MPLKLYKPFFITTCNASEFRRLRTTTISYQETSYHSAGEIVPHIDHIVKFVLMRYEWL